MKKDNIYKAVVFHDGKVIILSGEIAGRGYEGLAYNEDGSVDMPENDESLIIMASNYLPYYPTINFNHVDLGIADIERLATEHAFCCPAVLSQDEYDMLANGFYSGYERCLTDVAHKRFTEQDMANFGQYCIRQFELFRNHDHDYAMRVLPEYIQEVFKPKVFDVELEVESILYDKNHPTYKEGVHPTDNEEFMKVLFRNSNGYQTPKDISNQIKLIKIIQPCTD